MNQSPTIDNAVDKLKREGDPLEKIICRDFDSLQPVLLPYAQLWANHIYPRRIGNGSLLQEAWQNFGGRHYTALIRLHHALTAKNDILELCGDEVPDQDYERLLRVHAACTVFWDNLGAAIDNFARAKVEAKRVLEIRIEKRKKKEVCPACGSEKTDEKFVARTLSDTENPKLSYAFERRHQFIHSILVPKQIKDGMIVFNLCHYDDVATSWTRPDEKFDHIGSKIEADWDEVLTEFGNSWQTFYAWLQEKDTNARTVKSVSGGGSIESFDVGNSDPLSGFKGETPPSGIYEG